MLAFVRRLGGACHPRPPIKQLPSQHSGGGWGGVGVVDARATARPATSDGQERARASTSSSAKAFRERMRAHSDLPRSRICGRQHRRRLRNPAKKTTLVTTARSETKTPTMAAKCRFGESKPILSCNMLVLGRCKRVDSKIASLNPQARTRKRTLGLRNWRSFAGAPRGPRRTSQALDILLGHLPGRFPDLQATHG